MQPRTVVILILLGLFVVLAPVTAGHLLSHSLSSIGQFFASLGWH